MGDSPAFPLGPALDFLQRLWRLDQALEHLSSRMEQGRGITAQQWLIVRCVGRFPGMTAGQLAGLLHVDPGTVSAALARLEAKGLVTRRKDPNDNRRVALGLTARGRSLDVASATTAEDAAEELLATCPPDELAQALSVIARFTELLRARSGEATSVVPPAAGPAIGQRRRPSGGRRAGPRRPARPARVRITPGETGFRSS